VDDNIINKDGLSEILGTVEHIVFQNEENGYTVCEVYTPFKEYEGNLINALPDGSNVDPHPNKEGHKLLAELVADAVK
jgi:hypothetical protein